MYMANMAMQPGNMVISDKMQFPSGGAVMPTVAGSGAGWYGDERDGFLMWLRGEFAAANAIIDSLCHHLKSVGEQGEYDGVIGSIQQRRCNWNPVLHMQQYFSVAEVFNALQQVTWRRQQQQQQQQQPQRRGGGGVYEPVKGVGPGKEYKKSSGVGFRHGNGHGQGHRVEIPLKDGHNSSAEFKSPRNVVIEVPKSNEKYELSKYNAAGLNSKPQIDNNAKSLDLKSALSEGLECEVKENPNSKGCANAHLENNLSSMETPQQKPNILAISKTFVATDTTDGKTVNVVDGLKMYEELFDGSGVKKMVSLVNDLRGAGKRGQFQGQTFTLLKRPMKGHGREIIQFGSPVVDTTFDDEAISKPSKDRKIEPIPSLFQEFIERLMTMQILTVKPDSCIIDIYNEGDHSQPQLWPHWYARPVCVLFLTECDMTFGRVIGFDHPGDYRGSIKLSLTPGSMLVMEGKSADYAKHAIPSIRKQRILVTLTKSQPRRATLAPLAPPSHWASPPSRSPNHVGPKHYVQAPTTGVLPPPNGIQPIFVPATIGAQAMAFPAAPVGSGWATAAPLRQHAPPGTGVFLPPGGNSASLEPSTAEKENGTGKHDNGENTTSPKESVKNLDENGGKKAAAET